MCLALYATFGKGFAYAGRPPVFVGEVVLVSLVLSLRGVARIPRNGPALITGALAALALVQATTDRFHPTVPLLETLRGLAPIYYSAFAFCVYALLREYEAQVGRGPVAESIDRFAARAAPVMVLALTVLSALPLVESPNLPTWPSSGVPLFVSRTSDITIGLVLVAGVLFGARRAAAQPRALLVAGWAVACMLVAFRSRGALLALLVGLLLMRPNTVRIAKGVFAISAVLAVLYVTGLRVEIGSRSISYDSMGDAVQSILSSDPEGQVEGNLIGTRNWRVDWWGDIWDDVVDGPMIAHGHGWGDNLAVRHGVTASRNADDPRALRLPHNVFFSLAGRAGVLVALAFVAVPLLTIAATLRKQSGPSVPQVDAARGAVAAALVAGAADVYLESPHGGIVFWMLIGYLWWATAPVVGATSPASDRSVPDAE